MAVTFQLDIPLPSRPASPLPETDATIRHRAAQDPAPFHRLPVETFEQVLRELGLADLVRQRAVSRTHARLAADVLRDLDALAAAMDALALAIQGPPPASAGASAGARPIPAAAVRDALNVATLSPRQVREMFERRLAPAIDHAMRQSSARFRATVAEVAGWPGALCTLGLRRLATESRGTRIVPEAFDCVLQAAGGPRDAVRTLAAALQAPAPPAPAGGPALPAPGAQALDGFMAATAALTPSLRALHFLAVLSLARDLPVPQPAQPGALCRTDLFACVLARFDGLPGPEREAVRERLLWLASALHPALRAEARAAVDDPAAHGRAFVTPPADDGHPDLPQGVAGVLALIALGAAQSFLFSYND